MEIVFLKRWRGFRPEQITDFPDGAANLLIRRGFALEKPKPPRRRRKPMIDDVPKGVETL